MCKISTIYYTFVKKSTDIDFKTQKQVLFTTYIDLVWHNTKGEVSSFQSLCIPLPYSISYSEWLNPTFLLAINLFKL